MKALGCENDARDCVKDVRTLPLGSFIPISQGSLHIGWDEAILVHSDRYPVDTEWKGSICHGGECKFLTEEGITRVTQEPEALCKSIGVSKAEGDGVLWRCMDTIIELRKSIPHVLQASASAVGQSGSEAQCTRLILERGNDLSFAGACSPGLDGVLFTDRRDHKVDLGERIQRVMWVT